MRALVVLPTYEEAGNIVDVLGRMRAAAPHVDVLVVDDNSPDGTADLAAAVARELGGIDVLRRDRKHGLGNAYRHGLEVGIDRGYDVLVMMDADLSHDPSAIPDLLEPLDSGSDAVIGSRYVPGGAIPNWTWHRRALSQYGNRAVCALLGLDVHDATSGFRAHRSDALKAIDVLSTRANGYGFHIELSYRMDRSGRRMTEVPIVFTDRARGRSKMSTAVIAEELGLVAWWGLRDRWRSFSRARRWRGRQPPSDREASLG
jgi:dolichol-phosphate mannosyltransferase